MGKRPTRFTYQQLVDWAEAAAERRGGEDAAIALDQIAIERQVHDTIFKPLLIPGALVLRDCGFVLYLDSRKSEGQAFREEFWSGGGRRLPPRLRFTIAHELVHTLAYDLTTSPPQPKFSDSSEVAYSNLEFACDRGAAAMLLPRRRVSDLMSRSDFFEPEAFVCLASRHGVSMGTLIRRLRSVRWENEPGAVAVINGWRGNPVVECAVTDGLAGLYLPWMADKSVVPSSVFNRMVGAVAGSVVEDLASTAEAKVAPFATKWMALPGSSRWLMTSQLADVPRRA